MTIEEARARADAIIADHSPLSAHENRDALYVAILREIPSDSYAGRLAAEALRLEDADLTLWYA